MRLKERYICRGHDFLTIEMPWSEFEEWRDTMQAIGHGDYTVVHMEIATVHDVTGDTLPMPAVAVVQVNDRIDDAMEAYTAAGYLAGYIGDAEAHYLTCWRENAEETKIEMWNWV